MSITLYQASIPLLVRGLNALAGVLKIAEADTAERKIDPAVLISARLYPDMHPLTSQVQIATDGAKGFAARLAGIDNPVYEDNEATFAELQARIAKTVAFLQSVKPEQIDGGEDRQITLKFPQTEFNFSGQDYLTGFVLPNFYFHLTAAYAILRKNGVKLGKRDFLGAPN